MVVFGVAATVVTEVFGFRRAERSSKSELASGTAVVVFAVEADAPPPEAPPATVGVTEVEADVLEETAATLDTVAAVFVVDEVATDAGVATVTGLMTTAAGFAAVLDVATVVTAGLVVVVLGLVVVVAVTATGLYGRLLAVAVVCTGRRTVALIADGATAVDVGVAAFPVVTAVFAGVAGRTLDKNA